MAGESLTKGQRAAAWFASTMSAVLGASAVFIAGILWLGDIKSAAAEAKELGQRNEEAVKEMKSDILKGFEALTAKIQSQGDQVIMLAGKMGANEGRTSAVETAVSAEIRPQILQMRETSARVAADVAHVLDSQREVRLVIERLLERLDRPK